MKDRRVAYIRVTNDCMLELMRGMSGANSIYLTDLPSLPDGVRVVSVHEDFVCRGFRFVLQHESFDIVPEGQEMPEFPGGGGHVNSAFYDKRGKS